MKTENVSSVVYTWRKIVTLPPNRLLISDFNQALSQRTISSWLKQANNMLEH